MSISHCHRPRTRTIQLFIQSGEALDAPLSRGMTAEGIMAKGTPATVALEQAKVAFNLHEYDYDPNAARVGMQAAQALGLEPARLLKTLVVRAGDEVICVLVASDREINLKKLAAAAGAKHAAMLAAPDAERLTGYKVGGISPFGQRKSSRTFVDKAALAFPKLVMNGGRRGLQVELATDDVMRLLNATATDLT